MRSNTDCPLTPQRNNFIFPPQSSHRLFIMCVNLLNTHFRWENLPSLLVSDLNFDLEGWNSVLRPPRQHLKTAVYKTLSLGSSRNQPGCGQVRPRLKGPITSHQYFGLFTCSSNILGLVPLQEEHKGLELGHVPQLAAMQ